MEESSEKRRERLRALRMEAAEADNDSNNDEICLPNPLSNPLIESSATMFEQSEPCTAPRFDFYTDPMSAFSANKKTGKVVYQNSPSPSPTTFPGLQNNERLPSPAYQFHGHSPDQRMFYAQGFGGSGARDSNPTATVRPFPMDQGTPYSRPRSPFVSNFSSHQPRGMSSPNFFSGPRGNTYPNTMQDRVNYHSPSPSFGYRGSPSPGRGGHGYRGNMTSPISRWSSGRGSGSHGHHFSSDKSPRPEIFFDNSMLEDPWKFLQPSIWRINAPLSKSANRLEPWTSKSRDTKKAKVSEPFGSSQSSLAEYLAASFNEAVNDAPNTLGP